MNPDHVRDLTRVRRHDIDLDAIAIADAIDHVVGGLRQPTRVERQNIHVASNLRRHLDQDRRFGLKARDDDHARKRRVGPLQNDLGSGAGGDLTRRNGAHALRSDIDASRRASKPTRSDQLPKPSFGLRSDRNDSKSGRSSEGISVIGTLGAKTRLSRVPSKSPPSITSYLPSVVPTNPTSPRYGREQPFGQPLMRKLMRSSARPSSSSSAASLRMRPGSARSASATARPQVGMAGHAIA